MNPVWTESKRGDPGSECMGAGDPHPSEVLGVVWGTGLGVGFQAMIRSTWDQPYGPRGTVWKGPRKRGHHVYIDRYDHRGFEEVCGRAEMAEERAPSARQRKRGEREIRRFFPLALEREALHRYAELSPVEMERKKYLSRLFESEFRKLPSWIRSEVRERVAKEEES